MDNPIYLLFSAKTFPDALNLMIVLQMRLVLPFLEIMDGRKDEIGQIKWKGGNLEEMDEAIM